MLTYSRKITSAEEVLVIMAKLYFKYGAMGSSKSAQALITKFNYEERGMRVWLIKPGIDTRDGADILKSRIGLEQKADIIYSGTSLWDEFESRMSNKIDVIIADECHFFTERQIDDMRRIVDECEVPVICYGLRTDCKAKLFPASARLFELADKIAEVKSICECGRKAIINARTDENGKIVTHGDRIKLGGNELYTAMCHSCWKKAQKQ